jgi:phosphatidylcholine synthase
MADGAAPNERAGIIAAGLVHVFTATGAVCALFATLAALDRAWTAAFVWLGVALVIDGIDGTFARLARVETRLPRFSGERLDMIVDYTTYVFVPALMLLLSGIVSGPLGIAAAALILMSSLFHFCDTQSKTDDHYFVGFPAIWNLVAFYLFAFPVPQGVALLVIGVCAGFTFVPMRWLHPMRVRRWFTANVVAMLAWGLAAGWTVFVTGFPANLVSQITLAVVALYCIGLAFALPWAIESGAKS